MPNKQEKVSPAVRAALGDYIKLIKQEKKYNKLQEILGESCGKLTDDELDIYYKLTEDWYAEHYPEDS